MFHKGPDDLMPRKPDERKRSDLLAALANRVMEHGLQDASLQSLADGVGSSPRMLLHYFGSAEALRAEVVNELGRSFRSLMGTLPPAELATPERTVRAFWTALSSTKYQRAMRAFFEIYGMALQRPAELGDFSKQSVQNYLEPISALAKYWGVPSSHQARIATTILAIGRGLCADLLATGDHARIDTTVEWLAKVLDREVGMLSAESRHRKAVKHR